MPPTLDGIVTVPSVYSVAESLDRLETILHEKGITLFARIDQAGEAAKVQMTMPPNELLLFGNPKGGTPIMLAAPLAGLDLPLKVLAWQDTNGAVWLSFNDPTYLKARFALSEDLLQPIRGIAALVHQASI